MTVPRKGIRGRIRRRRKRPNRLAEQTRQAKAEAMDAARRDRDATRRAQAQAWRQGRDAFLVSSRGAILELKRRLRPVPGWIQRASDRVLGPVAKPLARALFWPLKAMLGLLGLLLDSSQRLVAWARARLTALISADGWLARELTPVRAVAAVAVVAAAALAASQFFDYRGVAVSSRQYAGELGRVAPVPFEDLKPTGSAHLYLPVALAVLAVGLIVATARGHWRLGRAVGLVGLAGIVLSLLVDAPQGLDAGTAGIAYTGTDAQLLEGFWAQVAASATLLVCGPLLGLYVKRASGEREQASRRARRLRTKGAVASLSGDRVGAQT